MADEKRYLVITPDRIVVDLGPQRDVVVELLNPEQDTGLLGIGLILRMTPSEARALARLLDKKAGEAEAAKPLA